MPSEFPAEDAMTQALRDGLRALPTPAVSPDFDARVLAALQAPGPWWVRWWQPVRPVLFSAAGSLGVMLIVLHGTLSAPLTPPAAPPRLTAKAPAQLPSIDALLDRPNLCAASLEQDWDAPDTAPLPADRRPEPRRHAALTPAPPTVA